MPARMGYICHSTALIPTPTITVVASASDVSIYVDTLSTLLGSLLLLSSHAFTMTGSGVLEVMSIKRYALK